MNVRRYSAVLLLCFAFLAQSASAASNVVISQIYPGGGSGGSTTAYQFDYVELFNSGDASASIGGYSVQYGSATGMFGSSAGNIYTFPAGTSIAQEDTSA